MTVTLRVRSIAWFLTGAILATGATVMFLNAWRVDAAPGDADTTLVPITPCRLIDTRQPGQPPLGPGETRTIDAHGTNGPIAGSQCTIPADAVGLSMNVTALDATAPTFWTISPTGVPRPEASSLNPAPGQPPTPNAVTSPISTAGQFDVFNSAGIVGMLIDVNGYYTKTSLTELASRLTDLEAAQATNTMNIATNTAGIAALDAREPFAVTARDESESVVVKPKAVVAVSVTAPAAGHVIVTSTTAAFESSPGESVRCSINQAATPPLLDPDYTQNWESSGQFDGRSAQMAGTRRFAIAANTTATYELVCQHSGTSGSSGVEDSVLTAIYTPAP